MTEKFRVEHDLLGPVNVPAEALYGAQTQRSIENFPLEGEKGLNAYPELIWAMLRIKKAAALANAQAGDLNRELAEAIVQAVDVLLEELPADQFCVHSFHGGGGISANMSVNEVVANLANRAAFNQPLGSYTPIHPNDHVNLNQSTNDVFTSACHLAIIESWHGLDRSLQDLADAFDTQGEKWGHVQKLSRTCLQDAVEISFYDFFSGYRDFVARGARRIDNAVESLHTLNLGGTLVGRQVDVSKAYFQSIFEHLRAVLGEERYTRSPNLFDSSQNLDDMVNVGSQLSLLARGLVKIAKDFRLLASGPQAGFGEIELPAVQPGSSAMPGKINPSIPEFLIQCSFQAIGRCNAAEMALDHGELDLNVWESIVVVNLLDAMSCLQNGIEIFRGKCLNGILVNEKRNRENIDTIIPLLTRVKLLKGYSFATRLYKESNGDPEFIRKRLIEIAATSGEDHE